MKIFYLSYDQQKKQNIIIRYWSRIVFVLSWIINQRGVAKAMFFLHKVKRSHVTIWNWIQKCHPKKISSKRKKIEEYIVDETLVKVGSELVWLWVAIEPE
ncbi:MAG TPA: hypothetical protein VJ799_06925, partial [Nitrososphaeraceae archaeon]|nr:hypothetical protein [Nitrososphaeraceae archaeon]